MVRVVPTSKAVFPALDAVGPWIAALPLHFAKAAPATGVASVVIAISWIVTARSKAVTVNFAEAVTNDFGFDDSSTQFTAV